MNSENLINSSVYYCKIAKFQENVTEINPFLKASLQRRVSCQLGSLSFEVTDNQATCDILNENLKNYSDLVDDKTSVNNYAESIKSLVKGFKNVHCQRWRSGLVADHEFQSVIPNYNCKECEEESEGIEVIQRVYQKLDKKQHLSTNDLVLGERQITQTEVLDSLLRSSSNFNQKRKNNFQIDDPPDSLKNRKLEEKNNLNFYSKTNKAPESTIHHKFGNSSESATQSSSSTTKPVAGFRTASAELRCQQIKKYGNRGINENQYDTVPQPVKTKCLGSRPRPVNSKFVVPIRSENNKNQISYDEHNGSGQNSQEECDPRLQHIDPKMVEMIRSEIMDSTNPITWNDIAGLQFAKTTIQEIVVWPMLRPDIFTGLRRPPKGILLFGPPGTGKTLIAKCIASQSKSTFFSISASSLTSKWIGDGEKMVRALFAVARVDQPSVVFIDEIDSLLSKRSDTEHESSRRIKTEFLVQLDGATTGEEDRLLIIGATNRPQELDEAARRRLVKRLYIPLPDHQARIDMITRLLSKERNNLTGEQIRELADLTDGYSGADVKILCQEAALGPIRCISYTQIEHITSEQVRPVTIEDFKTALTRVRSSVSQDDLQCYIDWDKTYGSGSF